MKYHVENNEVCNLYFYCNKTFYTIIVDRVQLEKKTKFSENFFVIIKRQLRRF